MKQQGLKSALNGYAGKFRYLYGDDDYQKKKYHNMKYEKNLRRDILKELKEFYDENGSDNYIPANRLKTNKPDDKDCINVIDQLLQQELIRSISSDGFRAIALNQNKIRDVKKELYFWNRSLKYFFIAFIAFIIIIWVLFNYHLN